MDDLPDHWRAAVLRRPGADLDLVDILRPKLHSGQVLVRLNYSGVCRSQLMEVRGLRGPDRWVPHLLGHEGVGIVREVAADVSKVKPGDRVIVGWICGTGIESEPPQFQSIDMEWINAGRVTTFSEWSVISENRVYLAPPQIPDPAAVLFGCALLTGTGMARHEAQVRPGQVVLINGAGGVGMAALIASVGLGADVVVAEPDAAKRDAATRIGARWAFDPADPSEVLQLRARFPEGVDVALDASGSAAAMEFAFSCLSSKGLLVFASHPAAGEKLSLDPHDLIQGKGIRGSWGGRAIPDDDIPWLAEDLVARGLSLDFLTPKTYHLNDVNQALRDLEVNATIRPLLRFT